MYGKDQYKFDYLKTLYSSDELIKYLGSDLNKLNELYQYSQPVAVKISSLENNYENILVDSPDGYVPVLDCVVKHNKEMIRFIMTSGRELKVSTDHLFQTPDFIWVYSCDLKVGDRLLSDDGFDVIDSISVIPNEDVYDLSIDHENHRYYTNGIVSHNTGKSLFLQNLALNWMQMGKNVVYISLELSEELVGLRFDAMITGMGTRDIFKEMNNVATELGMIGKFGKDGHKWGKLNIKKMPEAGTTVNDIRAYLKEYELQTGIRPDAICVDYLDLLYPNSKKVDINSAFNKDKYTSEELRGLAAEWNILCATASQLNRNSVQEQNFDASHIAGGISKINTADNVLGIFTSQSMKENGEYQIQFLKTRSSSGVGSKVYLQFDKTSLRIIDSQNGEEGTSQLSGMAGVAKLLEKRKVETTVVPTEKTQNKASNDVIARMRALGAAKSNE